jgi:predicted nuclease of predicted toxin-antitoxin system
VRESLKLYLDQMLGTELAQALREEGHDVIRAFEVGQDRADDAEILQRAIVEDRVLITLDEHFGDWVVLPLGRHSEVIRVKVAPSSTKNILGLLLSFLRNISPQELKNHLVILSSTRSKWIRTA